MPLRYLVLFLIVATAVPAVVLDQRNPDYWNNSCKCIPGDQCWPGSKAWSQLNATVGGRLIATDQVATVCHGSTYNGTACEVLKTNWDFPAYHLFTASEFDAPFFQNQSCDPYTPVEQPCTLGNYASYSINVSSAADVQVALRFAKGRNIRLVIKNTGHDYLGKSTGKGSLSLWMFNMKGAEILTNFTSKAYSGPAIRIKAGMMASEAYAVAHQHGYRMVGGSCATVGLAGGYTQGGGHSPLTGYHGMGADNVLEWEVVTPNGTHLIASPEANSDLYWALSGGGGGVWGIVLSMLTKLHKEGPVGGLSFSINSSEISVDSLWAAVDVFHASLFPAVDNGTTLNYELTNETFSFYAATAPDHTGEQVQEQLAPFFSYLNASEIPYTLELSYFDTYYNHFNHYYGPLPYGEFPISQLTSSRLVHRSTVADNNVAFGQALRNITQDGHFYLGLLAFNSLIANPKIEGKNAILPSWRDSVIHAIVVDPWDWEIPWGEMLVREDELTNSVMPQLEAVTPGSGTYLNEANFRQPNWQTEFYGENYPRLLEIKRKYDPEDLLYVTTGVGSENWTPDNSGRLCRT